MPIFESEIVNMKTNDLPLYSLSLGEFKELLKELLNDTNTSNADKVKGPKESNHLLKIDELCALFMVSRVTIFAWIKKGKLKAYHVGTRLYFKKSDIDTLLNDPK